jgi:CRP-like cAMP-binding protein
MNRGGTPVRRLRHVRGGRMICLAARGDAGSWLRVFSGNSTMPAITRKRVAPASPVGTGTGGGASWMGLSRVALLRGLPQPALETIAKLCNWRRYPTGTTVVSREATDRDVYLIVSGSVRVTAFSRGGRQVSFRDLPAGESFGELAAIDGGARSADVVTLEETLIAALRPADFRRLVGEHATVCEHVLRRLTMLVRSLTERVFELSTLGVNNRIHATLLRLARAGAVEGNRARIAPAPSHAELATQVSTNREQVTRELSALARAGLLDRDGRDLVITDLPRLERMVTEVHSPH